jgi:arylsulfatase A-like enzyme
MKMSKVQNVIYIHTHDMGRFISPYGHSVPTPNLQAFSEESTLFQQAFCCGPTCSPSRAGLLTGVTPHESGMLGLAHRGFKFYHPEYHLAAYLKSKGFMTALCGIQHEFNCAWEQMPYEHVVKDSTPEGPMQTDVAWTDAAVSFLEQSHQRPFFLSYGLFYPHRDFAQADYDIYRPSDLDVPDILPDTSDVRRDLADYHYSVHLADACIGRVLDTIRQTGRGEDTLVIITTDHGIAFPNMKCNLTDVGMGVCLMMNYPGNESVGESCNALVSHLDVYPTICDLLGLEAPSHLEGKSLRPLFEKQSDSVRDVVFSEVNYHACYEPMRCVRTERYKLIRRFDPDGRVLANCDDSLSKEVLIQHGWADDTLVEFELYDLLLDPSETCNRAELEEYREIKQELEQCLMDWMQATNDPILKGPIPRPVGALINSRESVSPTKGPYEPVL